MLFYTILFFGGGIVALMLLLASADSSGNRRRLLVILAAVSVLICVSGFTSIGRVMKERDRELASTYGIEIETSPGDKLKPGDWKIDGEWKRCLIDTADRRALKCLNADNVYVELPRPD